MAGAGSAALNLAVRDVEERFLPHNAILLKAREELLALRASIQLCASCFLRFLL